VFLADGYAVKRVPVAYTFLLFLSTVSLLFHKIQGFSLLAQKLSAFQEELCSLQMVML